MNELLDKARKEGTIWENNSSYYRDIVNDL